MIFAAVAVAFFFSGYFFPKGAAAVPGLDPSDTVTISNFIRPGDKIGNLTFAMIQRIAAGCSRFVFITPEDEFRGITACPKGLTESQIQELEGFLGYPLPNEGSVYMYVYNLDESSTVPQTEQAATLAKFIVLAEGQNVSN
jgi:hypothetical protein